MLTVANLKPADLEVALKLAGVLYMNVIAAEHAKGDRLLLDVLKEFPNDANVLNNLAYLLLEPGPTYNPAEAVGYSRKRAGHHDRQTMIRRRCRWFMDTHAWALINSGRIDEGIAMLREALTKKRFVDGFYHLGRGVSAQAAAGHAGGGTGIPGRLWTSSATPSEPAGHRSEYESENQASLDRVKQMKK